MLYHIKQYGLPEIGRKMSIVHTNGCGAAASVKEAGEVLLTIYLASVYPDYAI